MNNHEPPAPAQADPAALRLLDLISGYWRAGVVSTFAELGIADSLGSECLPPAEVALRLGLDGSTCARFCRAAAAIGLLTRTPEGAVSLTDLGRALMTDAPGSVRDVARWSGSIAERATWTQLDAAVRTGHSRFSAVHGHDIWDFFDSHPAVGAVFDAAMTDLSRTVIAAVADVLDLAGVTTVTDVGGGRGGLLAAMLTRAPHVRGVLFDQPEVVALAPEVFLAAGVEDRVTITAGSFFDAIPAGSDLFVISNVLHNWDDDRTRAILRSVASAMKAGDQLAIVEALPDVDPRFDELVALMDMDMLVLCAGKQRTIDDYRALLAEVDIEITGVDRAGLESVVRATKIHPVFD
ncbi:hypothetical protein ALI144C_32220 [Actinosynnema sp. ALI-1.44]|uniref:methyltransferase n=1 Tax=Actinosynnema sp. ALI-1.44 TaxID=1933779 RepID=UPI00097BBFFB|nr:methyltransferase [Actinosynnema sp. ALI-1.44]ONI78050.1 hypothetical protein ALI144C_32220 [Actinosynnema sp. ALI-1.44]